jgi:large subunit ribosomal protein L32
MAHPRRKFSSARRDRRRSHDHAEMPTLAVCPVTNEVHRYHRAYLVDNDLYYRGKMVIEGYKKSK